jgi:hypothetical protein
VLPNRFDAELQTETGLGLSAQTTGYASLDWAFLLAGFLRKRRERRFR